LTKNVDVKDIFSSCLSISSYLTVGIYNIGDLCHDGLKSML